MQWLTGGKPQNGTELRFRDRRYRVAGTILPEKDSRSGVVLGMIYLLDLTELLQVRDEYIRSRPIVSILPVSYTHLSEKLTKFSRAQQRPRLCRRIGHDGKEQHAAEQPDPGAERGDDREILHAQPGAFHTPRAKEGCRKKAEHQHHALGGKRQAANMKIGQHGKPSLFNKTAQPGRVAPFSLAT